MDKEVYYYLKRQARDGHKHRCGIVYLVKKGQCIGRGVSLLNEDEDSFLRDQGFVVDKKTKKIVPFEGGLRKAKRRAMKALHSRSTSEMIQKTAAELKTSPYGILFKSTFNPTLTSFEKELLKDRR